MKSIRKPQQFKTLTLKVKLVIVKDIDKDSEKKQLAALNVIISLCHISLSTEARQTQAVSSLLTNLK